MADRSFILIPSASSVWRVATWPPSPESPVEISFPPQASHAEIAREISIALKAAGHLGEAIAICVPSAWCLSASISLADLPRHDTTAMLYRLEEYLPLAAESVVADFVVHNDSALGVCARLDAMEPMIAALETVGIPVQSIIPAALATAQGFAGSTSDCILLCSDPDPIDAPLVNVIVLLEGAPTHWSLVPATAVDLKLQLDLLSTELETIPHIQAIDTPPDLVTEVLETTSRTIDVEQRTGLALASAFAAEVLRGRAKPWVEFRRDQLAVSDPFRRHRRWIDAALVAGIALLLSITLVFLVRAHRYRQSDRISTSEMITAFHQHFPGWETPINVRAVVDAQFRRATGSASESTRTHASALVTLHDVLLPMMWQDHVQISRMAFHESSFEIAGRLASYEQLDALSKLAAQNGMSVAPVQSRKDTDGSWNFVLQGSKSPEQSSK